MGASVLIIDAEEDFANLLAQTLQTRGVDTHVTPDGKAGLDAARINIPDAIVLCVELARMSGYSICAKLKKDPTLKAVPLVITSAEATQETFEHHKKLKNRAEQYLKKPFAPEAIFDVLDGYITWDDDALPEIPIAEELAIEAEAPMTLSDQEAFGLDAPFEVPGQAMPPTPPPLPSDAAFDLSSGAGLVDAPDLEDLDDEARTMVGTMPIMAQVQDLEAEIRKLREERDEALARVSAAEGERDEAVQKVSSLPAGASQLPGASAGREVLSLKKEISKKDHEILELKDDLQNKGKELLGARDEHMELEGRLLQLQEESEASAMERQGLTEQLAETAAQFEESRTVAAQTQEQLTETSQALQAAQSAAEAAASEAASQADALQQSLQAEQAKAEELQGKLTAESERVAELEASLTSKTSDLESVSTEMQEKVAEIESLMGQTRGLGSELTRLGNELSAATAESDTLRGQLAASQAEVEQSEQRVNALQAEHEGAVAALQETRDRLAEAERGLEAAAVRDARDQEIRAKAGQALQIAAALLSEPKEVEAQGEIGSADDIEIDDVELGE